MPGRDATGRQGAEPVNSRAAGRAGNMRKLDIAVAHGLKCCGRAERALAGAEAPMSISRKLTLWAARVRLVRKTAVVLAVAAVASAIATYAALRGLPKTCRNKNNSDARDEHRQKLARIHNSSETEFHSRNLRSSPPPRGVSRPTKDLRRGRERDLEAGFECSGADQGAHLFKRRARNEFGRL